MAGMAWQQRSGTYDIVVGLGTFVLAQRAAR